ncbi:hypothetical protein JTB14_012654 [Gonioctena quinquepunctata]|nr:hypothetical protein JTB14_012654 [Gonioctena quinquepunctata]
MTVCSVNYYIGLEIRRDRKERKILIGQAYIRKILQEFNRPNLGIEYGSSSLDLEVNTDADVARDTETRRSTTGYVCMLGNGAVTWKSHRLSTTKAEYIAACDGAKEVVWLRQFLKDIGKEFVSAYPVFIDNQSAIRLIENSEVRHNKTYRC